MAAVPQFRFGPRVDQRHDLRVNIFSRLVLWLQVFSRFNSATFFLLTALAQAVSGAAAVLGLTETFTMVAAFCMIIYSLLLFYNGSIEYLSTRILPHP
jgi:hypothetical protein